MKTSTTKTVYFPFLQILTLIFVTLKLTGHITWSWLWVLSPLWIPVSFVVFVWLFVLFVLAPRK